MRPIEATLDEALARSTTSTAGCRRSRSAELYDAPPASRARASGSSRSAASVGARRSCWPAAAPDGRRGRGHRPPRRQRPRAAGDRRVRRRGRRRPPACSCANLARGRRRRPGAPRPPRSPTTPTATSTGRSTCCYVDGAHRYAPARADIRDWGARVHGRRDAADPRLVLVDRRHAGDRPRAARSVGGSATSAGRGRSPSTAPTSHGSRRRPGVATPPASSAQLAVVRPQRADQGAAHARPRRRRSSGSAARRPEWPY